MLQKYDRNQRVEAFLNKICVTERCWNWVGARCSDGYGSFWIKDRCHSAHRLAYLLWVGRIPDGYEVHHKCGNRSCVNPDHLKASIRERHIKEHVKERASRPKYCKEGHLIAGNNVYMNGRFTRCRQCNLASKGR